MVGSIALAPRDFSRHLIARKHKRGSRKRMVIIGLTLTSMVDMFSLLVIFLLQAFSASPELLVVAEGVQLPVAMTGREIKDAPVLSLTEESVFLDQKPIGNTQALLTDPTPLMEKLADLRTLWQKTHPGQKFPGEINLQAHRELSSTIVSRFMGMLPSQAFGSIQLAVVSGGGSQ
jgi:hypothetical protein